MTEQQKMWYSMGLLIGNDFKNQGEESLEAESLAQGIKDMYAGKTEMTLEEAANTIGQYRSAKMSKEGTAFLAINGQNEDVTTLPSGLQYKVLTKGTGSTHPKASDTVSTHYEGKLISGKIFDSSYQRGEPAAFPLNRVIAGWTEGIQLMVVGDVFEFYIPFDLGYGAQGAGNDIPPYATLIFKVELLGIQ